MIQKSQIFRKKVEFSINNLLWFWWCKMGSIIVKHVCHTRFKHVQALLNVLSDHQDTFITHFVLNKITMIFHLIWQILIQFYVIFVSYSSSYYFLWLEMLDFSNGYIYHTAVASLAKKYGQFSREFPNFWWKMWFLYHFADILPLLRLVETISNPKHEN